MASSGGERKGWLRLLIESVEVPLDPKEPSRLLFSTVQSLIPGAHGLYFRGADGARRALAFDQSGYVREPVEGWNSHEVFVHLAHGHRSPVCVEGPSVDYSAASDRFERNVSIMQKMLAQGVNLLPRTSSRKSSASSKASPDQSEAEVPNAKELLSENARLKKQVDDLETELSKGRGGERHAEAGEEHASELIERTTDAEARVEEALRRAEEAQRTAESRQEEARRSAEELTRKNEEVRQLQERLGKVEEEATRGRGETERTLHEQRTRADKAEWELGEHRHWLGEANARVASLENEAGEAWRQVEESRGRAEKAEWLLREKEEQLEQQGARVAELEAAAARSSSQLEELSESLRVAEEQLRRSADAPFEVELLRREIQLEKSPLREESFEVQRVQNSEAAAGISPEALQEKERRVAELEQVLEELRRESEEKNTEAERKAQETFDELRNTKQRLEELERSAAGERARAEKAEWELGEHRHWLSEANARVSQLENELTEAWRQVNEERGRAEKAEWQLGEMEGQLGKERTRNAELEESLRVAEEQLRRSADASFEVELLRREIQLEKSPLRDVEETFEVRREQHTEKAAEAYEDKENKVAELEKALEELRREREEELQRRTSEVEEALEELRLARKRIQELTDKEEELNNLHALIEELREKLREMGRKQQEAEWHLGEHRDWLKNERDKVAYLEEQLRRANAGESSTSRPPSRKNSTESGFGSIVNTERDNERSGSESPPERPPPKMKLSASALPDDLAFEMMALSKAKHRMAEEIRELKTRPDPAVVDQERKQAAEALRAANERCFRLEQETAHYKDVAARVNMDTFNAQSGTIARLEKEKADLEWKLGEHAQAIQDSKWKIGELESELARLRSLLSGVQAGEEKEQQLRSLSEEKATLDWKLGEVTRAWNDAKWRVGELEAALRDRGGQGADVSRTVEEKEALQRRCAQLEKENNDQKWRIGELESGYAHHEWLLSQRITQEEADGLRARIAELDTWLAASNRAENDAKWRIGELEEELRRTKADGGNGEEAKRLRLEKEALEKRCEELQKEWHAHKWRIGELEAGYAHHEWLLSQKVSKEDVNGLKERIYTLEKELEGARKAENDAKWRIGELEEELRQARTQNGSIEEIERISEEKRALEKQVAELNKQWNDQKWRIGELESGYAHHEWLLSQRISQEEADELRTRNREMEWKLGEAKKEAEDARNRVAELEHGLRREVDARNAETPGQLEENLRVLRAEKENLERRCAVLDKEFNDTKWRNGELEATVAHLRGQRDEERARVFDGRRDSLEGAVRDGSFVVRYRRPDDARFWQLTPKTSVEDVSDLRAVSFVIDDPRESDAVFVIGSFSAWESSARLSPRAGGRREVTLHLPRGRHEFRFIVEGGWANSHVYPEVPNPFGTTNNWISID